VQILSKVSFGLTEVLAAQHSAFYSMEESNRDIKVKTGHVFWYVEHEASQARLKLKYYMEQKIFPLSWYESACFNFAFQRGLRCSRTLILSSILQRRRVN